MREGIARAGVGLALLLGIPGQVISFFPGAAAAWFWVAAAGAALGMLSANRRVRVAAVVLVLVFTAQGWGGYQDGLRYEEYMKERDRQPAKS